MSTKTIHNKYQIEIRVSNQDQEDQDHEMQGLAPGVENMSIKTIMN